MKKCLSILFACLLLATGPATADTGNSVYNFVRTTGDGFQACTNQAEGTVCSVFEEPDPSEAETCTGSQLQQAINNEISAETLNGTQLISMDEFLPYVQTDEDIGLWLVDCPGNTTDFGGAVCKIEDGYIAACTAAVETAREVNGEDTMEDEESDDGEVTFYEGKADVTLDDGNIDFNFKGENDGLTLSLHQGPSNENRTSTCQRDALKENLESTPHHAVGDDLPFVSFQDLYNSLNNSGVDDTTTVWFSDCDGTNAEADGLFCAVVNFQGGDLTGFRGCAFGVGSTDNNTGDYVQ